MWGLRPTKGIMFLSDNNELLMASHIHTCWFAASRVVMSWGMVELASSRLSSGKAGQ